MLDTRVVRPILVPTFLILLYRRRGAAVDSAAGPAEKRGFVHDVNEKAAETPPVEG